MGSQIGLQGMEKSIRSHIDLAVPLTAHAVNKTIFFEHR